MGHGKRGDYQNKGPDLAKWDHQAKQKEKVVGSVEDMKYTQLREA
jgi:hypothetical protein